MASFMNLNVTDIRDAVAEALKQHNFASNAPSVSSIGEEVGKSVSAVLETALSTASTPVPCVNRSLVSDHTILSG